MDFQLSDGQQNLKQMVHWLAENEVRKMSLEADKAHGVPDDFLLKLKKMGVSQGASGAADDLGQ